MADKTLKLEVITPEQIALQDVSTSVVVPAVYGDLGIWPNHAPLLAGLKPGVITYKTASGTEKLVVSGGFIEVSNNVISIIAPAAEKSRSASPESGLFERTPGSSGRCARSRRRQPEAPNRGQCVVCAVGSGADLSRRSGA